MADIETADAIAVVTEPTPEAEKPCQMHPAVWVTIGVAVLAGLGSVLMLRNVMRRNTTEDRPVD